MARAPDFNDTMYVGAGTAGASCDVIRKGIAMEASSTLIHTVFCK